MAIGDITATDEGTFVVGSTEMLTELNTLNTAGADATSGAATADIIVVPNGQGQATIYKLVRAAA